MISKGAVVTRLEVEEQPLINGLVLGGNAFDKFSGKLDRSRQAANEASFGLLRYEQRTDRTRKSTNRLGGSVNRLRGRFNALQVSATGAITAITSGALIGSIDRYNELSQRIKTATKATDDYLATQRELESLSKRTGTALEVTAGVYQGLARVAPDLKASNKEILQLVGLVEELSVIGGTSKEGLKNSLLQFTQGLAAGVFRAEEFNSLMENNGELVVRMARGMDVSQGELREMVKDGKLLSEDVFQALLKQSDEISTEFALIDRTIGRAFARAKLSGIAYLATLDKSIGLTASIASGFDSVGEFFDGKAKWGIFLTMWDQVQSFTGAITQNIADSGVNVDALGFALKSSVLATLEGAKNEAGFVIFLVGQALGAIRDLPVNLRAVTGLLIANFDQMRIGIQSTAEIGIALFSHMWEKVKLKATQTWLAVKVNFVSVMSSIFERAGLGDLSEQFGMSQLLADAKANKVAQLDLQIATDKTIAQIKRKRQLEIDASVTAVGSLLQQREAKLEELQLERDKASAIRDQAAAVEEVTNKVNDQKPVVEEVQRIWGLWEPTEWSASWDDALKNWNEKVGDSVANVIFEQESLSDALSGVLRAIAKDVISSLAAIAAKRVALFVLEKIGLATTTVAAIASGIAVAAAWAPAAALASLASFGANAVPASAGIASTFAVSKGIAIAGQAHDGLESVPRTGTYLLEGGERVVNVRDNRKLSKAIDGGLGESSPTVNNVNNSYNINLSIEATDADSFAGREEEITAMVLEALNQARAEQGEAPLV